MNKKLEKAVINQLGGTESLSDDPARSNIRILSERTLNDFERWAHFKKGMLIDLDENGQYKSLETRAYADTWQAAQETPLYYLNYVLKAVKTDRRIGKAVKTDIRKDFTVINAIAQADKFMYEHRKE